MTRVPCPRCGAVDGDTVEGIWTCRGCGFCAADARAGGVGADPAPNRVTRTWAGNGARCSRVDCIAPARWVPVLVLRPADVRFKPLRALVNLPTCQLHMEGAGVDDIVGLEGWQNIVDGFRKNGMAPPVRARTALEWEPLDNPPSNERPA